MQTTRSKAALISELVCLRCGASYGFAGRESTCAACAGDDGPGILDVRYDMDRARAEWRDAVTITPPQWSQGLFRYWPLLPVTGYTAPIRPGGTPLVDAPGIARALGLETFSIKDEGGNPSGSLKDRATAIAVEMALARGARRMGCASAGNAALSLATWCRSTGLACRLFVPRDIAPARLDALRALGAEVRVCDGDYDFAYAEAERDRAREGWESRSCAWNPFLVEGKKTVSFEIAEHSRGQVPDVVAAPVGDGCTLGAIGKGFRELVALGVTSRVPRLVGSQSEAIQPLVRRFDGSAFAAGGDTTTRASSIAVRHPRNAARLLGEVRASGGTLVAVPDRETADAAAALSRAGLPPEFTSATALAALVRLARSGALQAKSAVLVLTARERSTS